MAALAKYWSAFSRKLFSKRAVLIYVCSILSLSIVAISQLVCAVVWMRDVRCIYAQFRDASTGTDWLIAKGKWTTLVYTVVPPQFEGVLTPVKNSFALIDDMQYTKDISTLRRVSISDWAAKSALTDRLSQPNRIAPLVVGSMHTGWPLRCLAFDFRDFREADAIAFHGAIEALLPPAGATASQGLVVPRRIDWFAVGVMFAVIDCTLLAVYSTLVWIRRHLRRKSGKCIACGYLVENLPQTIARCPECGHNR